MYRQRLMKGLAGLAVVGLLAAGCGEDDDDDAQDDPGAQTDDTDDTGDTGGTTEPEPEGDDGDDVAAYCEAALAVETAPPPDVDFESASPEEMSEALKAYATDVMGPLADDIVAVTPDEVADEIDVLAGAVEEMASTGDPTTFDQPDTLAASEAVHEFDLANCGWTPVEVTAADYRFEGLGSELAAGVTSFELANEGAEVHELLLLRRNDGVTQSAEELLALPQEEAQELVTPMGEPAFAGPGDGSYAVADLTPGEYIAVCFVPVGTTQLDGPPPEGPPHAMQGMITEFTVS